MSRPFRPLLRLVYPVAGLVLLASSIAHADQAAMATGLEAVSAGEPATVVVWNRPIVTFRAAVGGFTPERRVEAVERRIRDIPHSELNEPVVARPGSLGRLTGFYVIAGSRNLMGLIPEDLDPDSGITLEQYAQRTAERLQEALRARAEQRQLSVVLEGVGYSIGATLLFALVAWAVVKGRRRALKRLHVQRLARLKLFGVDVLPAFAALERGTVRVTALSVMLVAAYLWLSFVFVQFPFSEPWGTGLGRFLRNLLVDLGGGVVDAVPGLFTVVVIFLFTRVVSRAVTAFFVSVEHGEITLGWLEPDSARATRRVLMVMIWLFALTVAYPYIPGSSSDAFKGVSVFAGLMISLGSAGLINQLMSGLVVVYSRALRPGDLVKVGDTMGVVSLVGVLSTKISTARREEITIPNAVLVGNSVTNYTRLAGDQGVKFSTTVTIGYDTPWRQVHAMLVEAAGKTEGIRPDPAPYVVQRALSDFYVEYELRFHVTTPETLGATLSALHANIQDTFNEYGVQIMSPHFESQPEQNIVVPRSHWYPAPARAPGDAGGKA